MTLNKQVRNERCMLKMTKRMIKPTIWATRCTPSATQETSVKNLVHIMNMPEGPLDAAKNARDSSKNTSEQDDKKFSPLEKSDQVTSNDNLNAYGESDRDDNPDKGKEQKKNTWRMRKIIHMEFKSDDDVDEQAKNSSDAKTEGKVRVRKKTVHYYEISSDEEEGKCADLKNLRKPKMVTKINEKMMKMIRLLFGDSAATSHMTNNKTGVYDLTLIRGSVMIGNGESISCTHKGKLDVICKHKDGSTARQTWEVKIVPQLNHDLFSFIKAMKEGWQMNGRWKEGGLMIELFQTTKSNMRFDRMIP